MTEERDERRKKALSQTLPNDQVLALARPDGGVGGPGEMCLIVSASLGLPGGSAGECQQKKKGSE